MRKHLSKHPLCLVAICAIMAVLAVGVAKAINIHSTKYGTPNGLTDNTVRAILQDSRGFIWFGTFDGLSRYDGYSIIPVAPAPDKNIPFDSQVRSLIEDRNGYLWILGTHGTVSCFDVNGDDFVDIFAGTDGGNGRYTYIEEMPDGSIWLWGESGAIRFLHNDKGFETQPIIWNKKPLANVTRIEQLPDSRVLLITSDGLWQWKEGKTDKIDASHKFQWILPLEKAPVLITHNGEILRLDADNSLVKIGNIPGGGEGGRLPAAFENRGKWYVTSSSGGVSIDSKTLAVNPIREDLAIQNAQVIRDGNGDLWLHNDTGNLYYFDKNADRLVSLKLFPERLLRLIDMERFSVVRDRQGRAWISTGGNGLFLFNPKDYSLQQFSTEGGNYRILPSDRLLSSAVDHLGNVWIGGEHSGAAMLNFNTNGAEELPLQSGVRSIHKLKSGEIIIGGLDGKIYKYSPDLNRSEVIDRQAVVYDVASDAAGNLFEATRGQGIAFNGSFNSGKLPKLTSDDLFSILVDNKNRIWAGTFGSGLDVLIPASDGSGYVKKNFLNKTYAQKRIRDIFNDSHGYIWVATNQGAYRLDPDRFISGSDEGKLFSLSDKTLISNEVHSIIEDKEGRIWIGGTDGISILDFSAGENAPKITNITREKGLSHHDVQALVREGDDYIWATTLYGASRINVKNLSVDSYAFLPMPGQNVHNSNSAVVLDDGRLLFGTNQGAYTIDPRQLTHLDSNRPITVTSLRINGEKIPFSTKNKEITEKDGEYRIVLPYDRNSLDFSFSTFDFNSPKLTRFRYRLEPTDTDWSESTPDNSLSFKNLSPGSYILRVEAAGPSGKWDKSFVCHIKINVPWWSSWWAKTLYVLLILGGGYLILRTIKRINNLNNQIKIEEQLTDYKLEFFTNISHEFRTPLTLIQVSLEKLHDRLSSIKSDVPSGALQSLKMPLATLDKNSRRMSRLIDELLTFRKVEKGKMVLYPEKTEIISFLHEIFDNFKAEAQSKHLKYEFRSDRDSFEMNIDRGAMEKIVNNLISNALKYTREHGDVLVSVCVDTEARQLSLQVFDNGVGIPAEKREQLFSRFMQSAMSRNSIGVGLHLTFGLVQLHRGSIVHADNPGGGSIFTVTLPTDIPASEHVHDDTIGRPSFETIFKGEDEYPVIEPAEEGTDRKRMLIIDDDADIRNFLSNEFSRYYIILLASDGASGLETARNNDVHIIICDVMMPDMSGFEVTRMLKEDFATSHIPVIQLTALSDDDCQMEGISSGADAYITKPFNLKFLMTRVAKLIEQRENLFAKFSSNPTLARPQLPMTDKDKEFADKLTAIGEREIDNPEFSVDDFAAEMALGRTIFFRKVKGVTGYTPKEFLRVMRMKKAAELLLTTDLTITEISYQVGMSDPAYFNKCFKAQFGKAPSVYQKENKK